ncbi:DoxX family protein [Catenuloplanes japonicus]|uniref:DoxX family protein n=1 Tax=Catenuloplanes japonicus TaxID=33876 RepID=UPI00052483BB|nr:membrane protein [Catenuloplanes japonicus]
MIAVAAQALLGLILLATGTGHLTVLREEFHAQVPTWIPLDAGFVVIASGVVEVLLGLALLTVWRQPYRAIVGAVVAAFFVAIFPGNIAQFTEHRDAFGLDSDLDRGVRLLFQPLLVVWALAATHAVRTYRRRESPA